MSEATQFPAENANVDNLVRINARESQPFAEALFAYFTARKDTQDEAQPDAVIIEFPDFSTIVASEAKDATAYQKIEWAFRTTFFADEEGQRYAIGESGVMITVNDTEEGRQMLGDLAARNAQFGYKNSANQRVSKSKQPLPKRAHQSTFIEARTVSHAVSDAQNLKDWAEIDGQIAFLHSPRIDGKKSPLGTKFEPTPELWNWRGVKNPTKEAVKDALKNLNFETNITFQVTLACLLQTEHARRTFTLDEIIKLIGRNTDARRSGEARDKLRREVWGNLLALTSMPVIGARNGTWREPGPQGEKRAIMPKEALTSLDPLLVITGTKGTNTGEPPKEVSFTAGEWLTPWIGNREILSEFGDVLKLAQIPRGKVSGAWAACIGLALQQQWREEATKAQKNLVSRGKIEGPKIEVLKFRPFTRRELLTELFSCDDENSPNTILNDPKGRRARAEEYWQAAIAELKTLGVISYYREREKFEEMNTSDLNAAWLDQPLDIRPCDEILKDALEIHNNALEAKKRGRRSGKKESSKEI